MKAFTMFFKNIYSFFVNVTNIGLDSTIKKETDVLQSF